MRAKETLTSFSDASVLVTGGTGSFGLEMVKHLLKQNVRLIRVLSRDEAKQDAMRNLLADERLQFFLGDTRDPDSALGATEGIDYVFHAAALKQVPSGEFFPLEVVKTNVNGSANVIKAAIRNGVKSVVCLSTDKAVYPINAMGMSKALMEKTAQSFSREVLSSDTSISITRYGNVMYSRGSVIPLFIRQIKEQTPLTITDPSMTRFLMSLEQSVALVEHALLFGRSGDLFVKKAPASTVGELARVLREMFNQSSLGTREIGFRHGEKLFESLLSTEEMQRAEDLGDYFRVGLDTRTLKYDEFFTEGHSAGPVDAYTSHNTTRLSGSDLESLLLEIPEIRRELGRE